MLAFPQRQRSDGFLGRVSVSVWIQITLQREKQRNKNIQAEIYMQQLSWRRQVNKS